MEKVDALKVPLEVGKIYLVPCAVIENPFALRNGQSYTTAQEIIPIINHPHNDKENGQAYVHYHTDYRFESDGIVTLIMTRTRINQTQVLNIEYRELKCIRTDNKWVTPVKDIKRSVLKHDCIHKDKCPHRGYDMSNVAAVDGIKECPLHGLKFNAVTNKIIA